MIEEIRSALAELETETAVAGSFTFNGSPYPCLASSQTRSKALGDGGFALSSDVVLIARRDLFATLPAEKQAVTYGGRNYVIQDVITPPGEAFVRLVCMDPRRGL